MEKIKITREQEKAFEDFIDIHESDKKTLERFIEFKTKVTVRNNYGCLNELSFNDFSLLLNGWYEVEEEFKVGDWIKSESRNKYAKVVKIESDRIWYQFAGEEKQVWSFKVHTYSCFDKVTEQWEIMLLELGREKPEFRVGDKAIGNNNWNYSITDDIDMEDLKVCFENNVIKYFYPIESRIEIKE